MIKSKPNYNLYLFEAREAVLLAANKTCLKRMKQLDKKECLVNFMPLLNNDKYVPNDADDAHRKRKKSCTLKIASIVLAGMNYRAHKCNELEKHVECIEHLIDALFFCGDSFKCFFNSLIFHSR